MNEYTSVLACLECVRGRFCLVITQRVSEPEYVAGSEGHDQYESGRRGRGICPGLQGHMDMRSAHLHSGLPAEKTLKTCPQLRPFLSKGEAVGEMADAL